MADLVGHRVREHLHDLGRLGLSDALDAVVEPTPFDFGTRVCSLSRLKAGDGQLIAQLARGRRPARAREAQDQFSASAADHITRKP